MRRVTISEKLGPLRLCIPLFVVMVTGTALPAERQFGAARAAMLKGLRSHDPAVRSRSVYELDGFDDSAAAQTLVRFVLSRDDRAQVYAAGIQLLGAMKSRGALKILTKEAEKGSFGKRARVLEALGRWRSKAAGDVLLKYAYDKDPRVRISALLGLERVPDKRASLALTDGLTAKEWPVRSAAIYCLGRRKPEFAIPSLIGLLEPGQENGRLLDDARKALRNITGVDFGVDYQRWKDWYAHHEGEKPPVVVPGSVPGVRAELAGVRTRAAKLVYLLALNKSMMDPVVADGARIAPRDVRAKGGKELAAWAAAKTKLDYARLFIGWSIDHLAPDTLFDVVTYQSSANAIFSDFVPATPENRDRARRRVLSLSASGNADFYAGMKKVFTLTGPDPVGLKEMTSGPEVVFVLSDGVSDTGEIPEAGRALEEVERWNRYRQIRFDVFAMGAANTGVLSNLAGLPPEGEFLNLP